LYESPSCQQEPARRSTEQHGTPEQSDASDAPNRQQRDDAGDDHGRMQHHAARERGGAIDGLETLLERSDLTRDEPALSFATQL
jgi:hypothetical protein